MTRFRISLSIGAATLGLILAAAPAMALNPVSYVSVVSGSDGNVCNSSVAPCATIGGALLNTEPGGEIKCLDNHSEPNITIDKPITIDCAAPGTWIAGFVSNSGITVDLDEATYPNGVVTLRNLNINGLLGNGAATPGSDGIRVIGGGAAVHIENVTITGFAKRGIDFRPTSSVDLFVRNTLISNNASGGIRILPAASAVVLGFLNDVRLDGNGATGLLVSKASGAGVTVTVDNSTAQKNAIGVRANGAGASILLNASTIAGNTTGLSASSSGSIVSFGNNVIAGNTTNGAPTSTVPLK